MTEAAARGQAPSLADWFSFLWRNRLIILGSVLVFGAAAVVTALLIKPKYRADVLFMAAQSSEGGLGQLSGQLGGLAALAGVGGIGGGGQSDEALEYLRSRTFTGEFIARHGLMPLLFADKWDDTRKSWRSPAAADQPTAGDAFDKFNDEIRQISEDRRTGVYTLSITWFDRKLAADWANALVAEADRALRDRRQTELARSIAYLTREVEAASELGVRDTIYKVMESQLKDAMLARTRDAYAFKVIDPAVAPDASKRTSPKRAMIAAGGLGFGFVVGVLLAAYRQSSRKRRIGGQSVAAV